jgi:hypothetical protein
MYLPLLGTMNFWYPGYGSAPLKKAGLDAHDTDE